MESVCCPRCRADVQADQRLYRCPACGIRFRLEIVLHDHSAQETGIVAGPPLTTAITTPDLMVPISYLERLLRRLRLWRWRFRAAVPVRADEEPGRRAIGWRPLALAMLPYLTCGPLLIVFPAVAYLWFKPELPELPRFPDVDPQAFFITCLILAAATVLTGIWTWQRVKRLRRDIRRTRLLRLKNAHGK